LLFGQYLELVKLVKPLMLLIENVQGFAKSFTKTERGSNGKQIYETDFNADKELRRRLIEELDYVPFKRYIVKAKDFGVPQLRPRYILIAVRKELLLNAPLLDPFNILQDMREKFLSKRGLPVDREVTLYEAISDLERVHGDEECTEPGMSNFRQGIYGPIQEQNPYQALMRRYRNRDTVEAEQRPDSHRFANHTPVVEARFHRIIHEFRPGIQLSSEERKKLGLNKHRIAPLAPNEACHTLTSLPDDLVHYSEPRIPTVREYARIQSFPDWFEFKAKYTTGDKHRREQVPRYTQVANAVPPLLAEALGLALERFLAKLSLQLPLDTSSSFTEEVLAKNKSSADYSELKGGKESVPVDPGTLEAHPASLLAAP
jgi:DNA (cytosine-5)-methyltransferase 1